MTDVFRVFHITKSGNTTWSRCNLKNFPNTVLSRVCFNFEIESKITFDIVQKIMKKSVKLCLHIAFKLHSAEHLSFWRDFFTTKNHENIREILFNFKLHTIYRTLFILTRFFRKNTILYLTPSSGNFSSFGTKIDLPLLHSMNEWKNPRL